MATHSSILAWRIPWTEEPGGGWLQSTQGCAELDTTEQLSTQHHFKCNCCSLSLPWQGVVQAPWKVQSTGAGLGIREE